MMINLCGRLQRHDEAQELLRRMDADGVERNGITYNVALNQLAVASAWAAALETLGELKGREELSASTVWSGTYLSTMSACARAQQPVATRALFEELRARQAPTANHWNAVLLSHGTDTAAAKRTFDEMRAAGITPRISDWKVLMRSHRDLEDVKRVYLAAVKELPEGTALEELWATVLRCALDVKDLHCVRWVYQQMREKGVEPNSKQAMATPALRRALNWARDQFVSAKAAAVSASKAQA